MRSTAGGASTPRPAGWRRAGVVIEVAVACAAAVAGALIASACALFSYTTVSCSRLRG
ncbi:MAG TPA: hypothetical protein VMG38_17995 [Trebonia sp.]|nr:hypothetical protein [Trebonia sp.]